MNIIIFSMNRACQLDNLLSSLKTNYIDYNSSNITVIYKHTNEKILLGYEKCSKEHSFVKFVLETDFRKNVIEAINSDQKHTMFLVDDILIVRKFSLLDSSYEESEFTSLKDQDIICHSLRLYPSITECYALNEKETKVKNSHCVGSLMIWDWREQVGDWGYPMSVDGHIFKTNFIKKISEKINYSNPNIFEANMANLARLGLIQGTKMSCSSRCSKLLNIPANIVQNVFNNKNSNKYAVDFLNEEYLTGHRLSFEHLKDYMNTSVHVDLPLIWKNNTVTK